MDPRLRDISIKKALSAIADIAMPRVCVVCGTPLIPQESHICTECLADLPKTRFSKTSHNPMADRLNALVEDTRYCFAAALYYYGEDAGYKNISQELKYRRNFNAGKQFGRILGKELSESEQFADVDLIVPVPLHWTRKWKRGYNQAEIIAEEVADVMGKRTSGRLLRRIRVTKTQTRLGVEGKKTNVEGAFRCRHIGEFRHILLIDDVFTTGSTLAACHAAVRACYDDTVRISVATLAYVNG